MDGKPSRPSSSKLREGEDCESEYQIGVWFRLALPDETTETWKDERSVARVTHTRTSRPSARAGGAPDHPRSQKGCPNMPLDIVASEGYKTLTQDAHLWNLAHPSLDGIRVTVYAQNQPITLTGQAIKMEYEWN